ncbi:LysR family transcriptional regulator [Streptomyces lichenis]|uniref:LysR family transcriptional regulator n=1 Tax=Streptomyces lichenis TaxID=2306967 RepID=A0ABT0ICE9_9ACTN|nr:LysR family transcriptional regulator [Streptomyces lichenis]MCK8679002.1 LysR family transcriptional regulator [Streptomyces lichenis]
MELRQLECFVTVAEEAGVARAAERLGRPPATVGAALAALERELGLRLFDRAPGAPAPQAPRATAAAPADWRVRLTAAGERLLPEARAALVAAGRVRATAAGIAAGTEGLVRLGTARAFADRVYRAVDRLATRHRGLRVRLERAPQEARLAAVRSGTFDAALVRTVRGAEGVLLHPLWAEPLIAALPAGHPLAAEEHPDPARLARLPLRLAPRAANPAFHDLVTGALPSWTPGPPFTTLPETLAALAADPEPSWTLFHPVGPPHPAGGPARSGPRGVVFRTLPGLTTPVSLAVPADRPPAPAVRALLDALLSVSEAGTAASARAAVAATASEAARLCARG